MKITALIILAAALSASLVAQETAKPVPKDSARVYVQGCSKGRVFTTGPRSESMPGPNIPEGMHLRMNGPKAMMKEIEVHEGAMIEVTGLMKKGQYGAEGVGVGGGGRISPGPSGGARMGVGSGVSQNMIDVEGWRSVSGRCPSR